MKKILLVFMCLFIFTGCENAKLNPDEKDSDIQASGTSEYDSEYYEIIGLEKFKEVYASETPTLIYFGASYCGACESFKPIAKQYAKENEVKVYFVQLDAEDFTAEDGAALNEIVSFDYIPFVTVYKNKELLYGESGVHSLEELKSLATEHGLK